jgi:ABC-type polysaccharide/polyol phosphate transport system ATPase subunit
MSSFSPDVAESATARRRSRLARAPVVIEARGVTKSFQIPSHRVDSLRERVSHPLRRLEAQRLTALEGVSFDVRKGEFFGIVGRNGSGKSTLLKIMASIYRSDAGRIRMAGRMAPFIELGVGFNPEMSSRENVVMNGVLMGLTRREARRRFDSVLEFAELEEFVDMKIKNYSSGMMVRLAFAVMVEADADVMLIDEVLAVGDAAFAQKCMRVFRERRAAGRTIVLVTHDMATVQSFCDRAMLIHDSELQFMGDPEETALRYYRLNFGGDADEVRRPGALPDINVHVVDAWLQDADGRRLDTIEQHQPFELQCIVEARRELVGPVFGFHFVDSGGATVFGFNKTLKTEADRIPAGARVRISGQIENRLLPGVYNLNCWIARNRIPGDIALHTLRLFEFSVFGTEPGPGSVQIEDHVRAELIDGPAAT